MLSHKHSPFSLFPAGPTNNHRSIARTHMSGKPDFDSRICYSCSCFIVIDGLSLWNEWMESFRRVSSRFTVFVLFGVFDICVAVFFCRTEVLSREYVKVAIFVYFLGSMVELRHPVVFYKAGSFCWVCVSVRSAEYEWDAGGCVMTEKVAWCRRVNNFYEGVSRRLFSVMRYSHLRRVFTDGAMTYFARDSLITLIRASNGYRHSGELFPCYSRFFRCIFYVIASLFDIVGCLFTSWLRWTRGWVVVSLSLALAS